MARFLLNGQWYWKGDFVKELSDPAIDVYLEHAARAPGAFSLTQVYPIDDAVHRVGPNETAWHCRETTWSMVIAGIDADPTKVGAVATWAKGYWEAVHPHTLGGAYVNFMMRSASGRPMATTMTAWSPSRTRTTRPTFSA